MKPQIVNIINFIRGVEPRNEELNLFEPVANQVRLLKKYDLPGTFLIQYDAMLMEEYVNLLKYEMDEKCEIGGWLEIVQPLVEKAGLKWRGRPGFSWDWHANTGFSVGYTPEEREKLIDVFMEDFKSIFGYYPRSVGSWLIDAHTLAYMSDKYGITASCICRDQWGTDGYTLWGGYYNQAYYPSCKNVLSPAQTEENQIPVPVFRMLGSDPIYQYDAGLLVDDSMGAASWQPVVTLEPAYHDGGGNPEWVQWYFKENFNGKCLSFGYTQMGQENSFGWESMKEGLSYQIGLAAEKVRNGELKVETLADSGRWYKESYKKTPASAIAALSDWMGEGHKSVWYNSRNYRSNFFWEKDRFWIRDIHLFDEKYEERYLKDVCTTTYMIYDNLPVIDGNRWSGGKIRAGIYPVQILEDGTNVVLTGGEPEVQEVNPDELLIAWSLKDCGKLIVDCKLDAIEIYINCEKKEITWGLRMQWGQDVPVSIESVTDKAVYYKHNGYSYELRTESGNVSAASNKNEIVFYPQKGRLTIKLSSM